MINLRIKDRLIVLLLLSVVLAGKSVKAAEEATVREATRLVSSLLEVPEIFAADSLDKTTAQLVACASTAAVVAKTVNELTAERKNAALNMVYPWIKCFLLYKNLHPTYVKAFAKEIRKLDEHTVDEQAVTIDKASRSLMLLTEVILRGFSVYYHHEAHGDLVVKGRANKFAWIAEVMELLRIIKPRPFMGVGFEQASSDGMDKELYVQ